jgi:zinc protease
VCCTAAVLGLRALEGSPPPPDTDLQADPLVSYGVLGNGVRYALRPRTGSFGRISLRLVIDAGSLNENEGQRGLAHLVEHMAFNGSEHFAAGTLVEFFQRQGMALGADANASTTFDRTRYALELRHNDPAAVAQGLDLLRDFAGGLLFPPAMVAKEKGVVLSEKLARDSVIERLQEARMRFCLAGTLLPQRIAIGDSAIISRAGVPQLKAFYDAWYRPDRISIVAVGDFDPAQVATAIKSRFGRLRARGRPVALPAFGTIANNPGIHVQYLPDPELPGASINFTVLRQHSAPPDSAQRRLQDLPRQMSFLMFNRRLADVASRPEAPFTEAGAQCEERLGLFQETALGLAARSDGWRRALTAGEHELRRALQSGFGPAELKVASAVFVQQLEQDVRSAPTLPAGKIADSIIDRWKAGEVYMTPTDLLNLYTPALSQMSVETCNGAFRAAWASPARFVSVAVGGSGTGGALGAAEGDRAVAHQYEAATAERVDESAPAEAPPWSYTEFGESGAISTQRQVDQPALLLARFANGTRVNLKPTRFEADRIRVRVRVGTGRLEEPIAQKGLALLAQHSFAAEGLNRDRPAQLQQVLSGRTVSLTFTVDDDAFQIDAVTDREDLLLQLQWIAATLTDTAFRPEADAAVKARIGGVYTEFSHSAAGQLGALLPGLLASNDRRFGYPSLQEVNRRTPAELRAWLEPQLRTGPLEITLVGDFEPPAALSALGRTLGALPARRRPHPLDVQRFVTFPAPPRQWTYAIQSDIPAAAVAAYWPTDGSTDGPRRDRLEFLAAILQDRVRLSLRERLGAAYSPEASSYAPKAFPGYGYLRTQVVVDRRQADAAAAALAAIGTALSRRTITADEVQRARAPLAGRAHDLEHSNQYWLEALASAQALPYTLDWARTRAVDFDTVTADDLNALAAEVFRPRNFCIAVVRSSSG